MDALLGFAGDVFVDRPNPQEPHAIFDDIREELGALDFLFANCEGVYTTNPEFVPTATGPVYSDPANVAALGAAKFSVMSMANNHSLDCGHSAMLRARQILAEQGIATCGAGANLEDARKPAIVTAGGCRVAVLAFSSVFSHGYEAQAGWPGLAPIHTRNYYELSQVGFSSPALLPPRVHTEEDPDDIAALKEAVTAARGQADVVVASFHWGDLATPGRVTDHERRVARIAIDAGADIVAGHHHHADKPIFYGLGHLVFDLPHYIDRARATFSDRFRDTGPVQEDVPNPRAYNIATRPGWPFLPMHPDTRLSMVAWVQIHEGRPNGIGFLPCRLQPDGRVTPYDPDSPDGRTVVEYFRSICPPAAFSVTTDTTNGIKMGRHKTVCIRPAHGSDG
jgi:poly-gamma-glutamate synthesis protein (capsule biosynthesis protein)